MPDWRTKSHHAHIQGENLFQKPAAKAYTIYRLRCYSDLQKDMTMFRAAAAEKQFLFRFPSTFSEAASPCAERGSITFLPVPLFCV